MMIDRQAISDRIMEGQSVPAGQLLAEQFFGTSKNLKPDRYDPAAAKQLLAEAGYPNGFGLTLHAPNNRYINDAAIAQAIAQYLTRNGVPTKLDTNFLSCLRDGAQSRAIPVRRFAPCSAPLMPRPGWGLRIVGVTPILGWMPLLRRLFQRWTTPSVACCSQLQASVRSRGWG
jgi:ABC-type transport system substrate-binding protein